MSAVVAAGAETQLLDVPPVDGPLRSGAVIEALEQLYAAYKVLLHASGGVGTDAHTSMQVCCCALPLCHPEANRQRVPLSAG
jgi:hypothetical protein